MSFDSPLSPSVLGNPATAGQSNSVVMASGAPASSSCTLVVPGYVDSVQVTNLASLAAYVAIVSTNNYTCTAQDTPVLANNRIILAAPNGPTLYAYAKPVATLAASANVVFTPALGGGCQS
jgi:hypothetical protein